MAENNIQPFMIIYNNRPLNWGAFARKNTKLFVCVCMLVRLNIIYCIDFVVSNCATFYDHVCRYTNCVIQCLLIF